MVNAQTSDVFFNMDFNKDGILEDNAQMIVDMLKSFNVNLENIPTVDELIDDYFERE